MQRGRAIILVAAATGAAALIFPVFAAAPFGDVATTSRVYGFPCAALSLAAVVAFAGDRGERLTGLSAIAVTSAIVAAAVVTGAVIIDAALASRDAAALGVDGGAESGLWLTAIAVGLGAIGLAVGMSRRLS
jgi:hypothetical protein